MADKPADKDLDRRIRELEGELTKSRHREEMLAEVAGNAAHDLKNVFGVSLLYTELLQEEISEGSPLRNYVHQIFSSTAKGAAITEDLLIMAGGDRAQAKVIIDINAVLSAVVDSSEYRKLREHHPSVTITMERNRELRAVTGSPVQLQKTVFNLISHAVEDVSGGGEVIIRTENRYLDKPVQGCDRVEAGDYAVLTVSDNGGGIRPGDLKRIFEPFYTKKALGRSGSGLGLAIVRETATDHGGYITVQSTEGEGAAFTLYLPVAREKGTDDATRLPVERYRGHGETVLVVDDLSEQRQAATVMLTRLGYRVQAVSSGQEAVAYLMNGRVDILVLDMSMPLGINGLETYRRILEINPKQKAVIASGFSETEQVKDALALGAGAFVKKPYVMEKIGVVIRQELDRQ